MFVGDLADLLGGMVLEMRHFPLQRAPLDQDSRRSSRHRRTAQIRHRLSMLLEAAEVGRRPSRGDARAEEVKRLFGEVERRVEEGWKKHLKPRGKALRSATCRIEISEASAQIRLRKGVWGGL